MTAGAVLAAALRRYNRVGPRTVDHRDRKKHYTDSIKERMLDSIEFAAAYDGYYSADKTAEYRPGIGAVRSHRKHFDGYRIDPVLRYSIERMTPWQFAGLLGDMVDAGVTNVGEGERFYAALARANRCG